LVFDFGGGTLDVTVLEMYDGILDVKTSVGDDKLGGGDVDEAIVDIFREAYKEQHGKKLPAPSRDRKAAQMLKEEAERVKKILSYEDSVQVDLPYLSEEGGISMTLTRETLESHLEDLLMRAMALVNEALSRARLRFEEVDIILPVGGSSRIPLFRRALEYSWGRPLLDLEDPD
jgi:molecular chaperone DnaK